MNQITRFDLFEDTNSTTNGNAFSQCGSTSSMPLYLLFVGSIVKVVVMVKFNRYFKEETYVKERQEGPFEQTESINDDMEEPSDVERGMITARRDDLSRPLITRRRSTASESADGPAGCCQKNRCCWRFLKNVWYMTKILILLVQFGIDMYTIVHSAEGSSWNRYQCYAMVFVNSPNISTLFLLSGLLASSPTYVAMIMAPFTAPSGDNDNDDVGDDDDNNYSSSDYDNDREKNARARFLIQTCLSLFASVAKPQGYIESLLVKLLWAMYLPVCITHLSAAMLLYIWVLLCVGLAISLMCCCFIYPLILMKIHPFSQTDHLNDATLKYNIARFSVIIAVFGNITGNVIVSPLLGTATIRYYSHHSYIGSLWDAVTERSTTAYLQHEANVAVKWYTFIHFFV